MSKFEQLCGLGDPMPLELGRVVERQDDVLGVTKAARKEEEKAAWLKAEAEAAFESVDMTFMHELHWEQQKKISRSVKVMREAAEARRRPVANFAIQQAVADLQPTIGHQECTSIYRVYPCGTAIEAGSGEVLPSWLGDDYIVVQARSEEAASAHVTLPKGRWEFIDWVAFPGNGELGKAERLLHNRENPEVETLLRNGEVRVRRLLSIPTGPGTFLSHTTPTDRDLVAVRLHL